MENSWTSQLIGQTVTAVEQWEALPCIVKLSGGYRVQIESLWRLLASSTLILTSRDEGQLFGLKVPVQAITTLSRKLHGHTLTAVHVTQGTADLHLHFGDHELQALADSSGYEAWQVEGPTGMVAVGQGGGNVAVWG